MQMKKYSYMFEAEPDIALKESSSTRPADTHYITSTTHMDPPGDIIISRVQNEARF